MAAQLRPVYCSEGLREARQLRRLGRSPGQWHRVAGLAGATTRGMVRNLPALYKPIETQNVQTTSASYQPWANRAVHGRSEKACLHSKYRR